MPKIEFYTIDEYKTKRSFTSIDLPQIEIDYIFSGAAKPIQQYVAFLNAYEPEIVYFEEDDPICGMKEFGKYNIYEKAKIDFLKWVNDQDSLIYVREAENG
jgi:hypothetical protein